MDASLPARLHQILVVEDNPAMRAAVVAELKLENYVVHQAGNGQEALAILQKVQPDLILSDINMPVMDGLTFCQTLRRNPRWTLIPFVFLTANDTPEDIHRGKVLGVEDYLTKPIDPKELLVILNARLLRSTEIQVAQIGLAYLETVNALANTIEGRDPYTRGHVERVARYAHMLAQAMGWSSEHLRTLEFGARLHDIGKIVVPDQVLNKPGKLTEEEWVAMRAHPAAGAKILAGISHLRPTLPYILYHHERWDGAGYPHGLKDKNIPIEGRLLAICDVYDALTTARSYHPAQPHAEVARLLKEQAGRQFDPQLVPLFLKVVLGPQS